MTRLLPLRTLEYSLPDNILARYLERPPTLGDIDMSLSFKITSTSAWVSPP